MIDLTLSSEDEAPPKRQRVPPKAPPQRLPPKDETAAPLPTGPARQAVLPADLAAQPLRPTAVQAPPEYQFELRQPPPATGRQPLPPAPGSQALLDNECHIWRGGGAAGEAADEGEGEEEDFITRICCGLNAGPSGRGHVGPGSRQLGGVTSDFLMDTLRPAGPEGGPGLGAALQGGGLAGGGAKPGIDDYAGGSSPDDGAAGAPKANKGGGRKRLTAEEREERERAKQEEKALKAAERERAKQDKAAAKAAEKERKQAEKGEQKRAKQAEKDAVKYQKEVGNALKPSMVGRYMRVVMSHTLAASPLGLKMVDLIPVVRSGQKDQTFPHEVQRDMPLAALGYRYCMWGLRLPPAAAAKLQAAEGCALEASDLPDPDTGSCMPLSLFPALLLAMTGDDLLQRLTANPAAPLAGLYADVVRAHPGATLLVYVMGLEEALRRRERANKSFKRSDVEDLLLDVTVGMPAVRLQYDCPETDLVRAATDILNLGYALSQQPRRRVDAYLEHFGSKTTVPLRLIKDVLREQGGAEQLTLCEALSQLVAPQRAAAIAAEYPSLAAIMEALRARPEGARSSLLARCRIPGVVPGKHVQQFAGPAAAANVAAFLQWQDGREEWKGVLD